MDAIKPWHRTIRTDGSNCRIIGDAVSSPQLFQRLFPNGHIFALLQSQLEYSLPPLCHLKLILSCSDKPRADYYWNNNVFQASTRIGGALALACPSSYHRHGTLLYMFLGFNKKLRFFVIGSRIMVSLSKVFPFCLY